MRDQVYVINCRNKRRFYIFQSESMINVRALLDRQLATGEIFIVNIVIGEEGVNWIIENASPSLHTLKLKGAFFGSDVLRSFPRGIFNNLVIVELSITTIYAENNQINNIGCKYLSKCSFNNMRKFSLASNFLDAGGVIHLQKAKWSTVTSFSLYNNVVGLLGMKLIGKFLFDNLESLCIKGCYISIPDLAPLMAFQYPLQRLYMSIPRDAYFETVNRFETVVKQKFHSLVDYDFI